MGASDWAVNIWIKTDGDQHLKQGKVIHLAVSGPVESGRLQTINRVYSADTGGQMCCGCVAGRGSFGMDIHESQLRNCRGNFVQWLNSCELTCLDMEGLCQMYGFDSNS